MSDYSVNKLINGSVRKLILTFFL